MHGILLCFLWQVCHVIMLHGFDLKLEDEQWMYELLWTCQPPDAIAPAAKGAWSSAPGARWIVKWRHGRRQSVPISRRVTWNGRVFTHRILLLWNYLEGIVPLHNYSLIQIKWILVQKGLHSLYNLHPKTLKVGTSSLVDDVLFSDRDFQALFSTKYFVSFHTSQKNLVIISIIIKVCRMHRKEIQWHVLTIAEKMRHHGQHLKVLSCYK